MEIPARWRLQYPVLKTLPLRGGLVSAESLTLCSPLFGDSARKEIFPAVVCA